MASRSLRSGLGIRLAERWNLELSPCVCRWRELLLGIREMLLHVSLSTVRLDDILRHRQEERPRD